MSVRLRVIDFETTGLEPPAQVVEVGICDLEQCGDGTWEVGEPESWLCGGVDAMPPEVRAVHHISLIDLEGSPPFDRSRLFDGAPTPSALVAHNYEFEARFLGEHGLPTICTLKAALRVWPDAPGHSNQVLRYWLEDRGLLSLDDAQAMPPHRAGPDAYVTAHILKALFAAGATGREMVAWTAEPRIMARLPFGKHKGAAWSAVPADYLAWAMRSELDDDFKWNAQREINRRRTGTPA